MYLHYKDYMVDAVQGNKHCLFCKLYEILKYTLDKRQSYCMLKPGVCIVTIVLQRVKYMVSKP